MLRNCFARAWSGTPPGYGLPPGWPTRPTGWAVRAAVACGTAAVAAAAAIVVAARAGGAPAGTSSGMVNAHTAAYVISRVDNALAGQHLVLRARTSGVGGPSISWAYGPRSRFEEFTGTEGGHALSNGTFTHHGGSERYIAVGTALIGGKPTGVYVTYYNREWSLLPKGSVPASACSRTGALAMAGPRSRPATGRPSSMRRSPAGRRP